MKQVDIGGFVLMEVPKKSYGHRPYELNDGWNIEYWYNGYLKYIQIPSGNYQIVGLAKDLTPDQWCEIFGTEYDAHCFMKQNKLLHETTLIIKKML